MIRYLISVFRDNSRLQRINLDKLATLNRLGLLCITCVLVACRNQPAFTFGISNSTATVFEDVTVKLEPRGEFSTGMLSTNNPKRHMNPAWPIPSRIIVFAKETNGTVHRIENPIRIHRAFHVDITVEIIRTGDRFDYQLRHKGGE